MISIIIPCNGYEEYLPDAERSAKDQSIKAGQIIVQRYEHDSVGRARNEAIKKSRCPYIVCLDADDELKKDFVLNTTLYWRPNVIVATGWEEFGEGNKVCTPGTGKFRDANQIIISSVFSKKMWEDVGGFDEDMDGYEDWDFWYRAMMKGYLLKSLTKPLVRVRVRSNSRNTYAKKKHEELKEYILNKDGNNKQQLREI